MDLSTSRMASVYDIVLSSTSNFYDSTSKQGGSVYDIVLSSTSNQVRLSTASTYSVYDIVLSSTFTSQIETRNHSGKVRRGYDVSWLMTGTVSKITPNTKSS